MDCPSMSGRAEEKEEVSPGQECQTGSPPCVWMTTSEIDFPFLSIRWVVFHLRW